MDGSQFIGHGKSLKFHVRQAMARAVVCGRIEVDEASKIKAREIYDHQRAVEKRSFSYKTGDLRARGESVAVRRGKLMTGCTPAYDRKLTDAEVSSAFRGVERKPDPDKLKSRPKFIADVEK